MLKIEVWFECHCLAEPRSQMQFWFPCKQGKSWEFRFLSCSRSKYLSKPCQLRCFCLLGQTCPLKSSEQLSFPSWSQADGCSCVLKLTVFHWLEPWRDTAGKSQRFAFWLETKPGALIHPALACQRTSLRMKPWCFLCLHVSCGCSHRIRWCGKTWQCQTLFCNFFCSFSEINC